MADAFEDPYLVDHTLQNFADSENNDEDEESDYEGRLYSLLHCCYEPKHAGDEHSEAFVYESPRTRVNRFDDVQSIVNADNTTDYGAKKSGHINSQSRNQNFAGSQEPYIVIESFRKTESKFLHSTPIRDKNFQNTFPTNSVQQRSQPVILGNGSPNTSEIQSWSKYSTITAPAVGVSSSLHVSGNLKSENEIASSKASGLHATSSWLVSSNIKSEKQIASSKASGSHAQPKNLKENAVEDDDIVFECEIPKVNESKKSLSSSLVTENKQNLLKCDIRNSMALSDTSIKAEDGNCSKYNLELRKVELKNIPSIFVNENVKCQSAEYKDSRSKSKQNIDIIVIDESSNDSVAEIEPPVKEPPLILDISSDEEGKVNNKKMPDSEDDIVVVFCGERKVPKNACEKIDFMSEEMHVEKRKKKHKSRRKAKDVYHPSDMNPPSWNESMAQYYNDSWGDEQFDLDDVRRSMSGKPSKWHMLYTDIAPSRNIMKRNIKCNNCNTYGHVARMCPEASKQDVCIFCGISGHLQPKCPTPVCLRCGLPASQYNYGCPKCSHSSNQYCRNCNMSGHDDSECPEIWRKYHSTTTEEGMANLPRAVYKPRDQQFCSNCAARGHIYEECRQSSKQGNWLKRHNTSRTGYMEEPKRRKLIKKRRDRIKKEKYKWSPNRSESWYWR